LVTETRDAALESRLFRKQGVEIEPGPPIQRRESRLTECRGAVVHEKIRTTGQVAMLASHGAPDQSAIPGVELLDTHVGLDDVRPRYSNTAMLGGDQRRAATGDHSAPAIAACATADQPHYPHAD